MYADAKIAKNVKCGRTKSEAIVCKVLAKEALKDVIQNLKEHLFFSISTDASNKENRKMFTICVRYFSLDETADQITKVLCETLDKHNLKLSQITSYGADNANVNFQTFKSFCF